MRGQAFNLALIFRHRIRALSIFGIFNCAYGRIIGDIYVIGAEGDVIDLWWGYCDDGYIEL